MEKPVEPQKPVDDQVSKDALYTAVAVAVAALKAKCPGIMVNDVSVYTYSDPQARIELKFGPPESWKQYEEARKKYREDLEAWNAQEAGCSVEQYREAKEQYDKSRGCEKGRGKDLEYYISRVIDSSVDEEIIEA